MIDTADSYALPLLVVGGIVISGVLIRRMFESTRMPAMIGFIVLGIAIGLALDTDVEGANRAKSTIVLLGQIGIITLLFRVGLESNVHALYHKLGQATVVWLGDVILSVIVVFLTVRYLLQMDLWPSLFVAAAMSATSIGVTTSVWRDHGALNSEPGARMLDVAELDDISAVLIMGALFAAAGTLQAAEPGTDVSAEALLSGMGLLLLLLPIFILGCYAFGRFLERPLREFFAKIEPRTGAVLFAIGAAILIGAMADMAGFSVAIGALFAGLAFSVDPERHRIDRAFDELDALFSPFFFVSIGAVVSIQHIAGILGATGIVLTAAVIGKIAGAGLPTLMFETPKIAMLTGLSMVPRAEVALIVMSYGRNLGSWAVPDSVFTIVVLATLATAVLGPVGVGYLLRRRTKGTEGAKP